MQHSCQRLPAGLIGQDWGQRLPVWISCKAYTLQKTFPACLQALTSRDRLAGVQAELILGAVERKARSAQPSNSTYLEQRVQYLREDAQLVDEESQGVMMAWEGPLMQAHAKVLFACSPALY